MDVDSLPISKDLRKVRFKVLLFSSLFVLLISLSFTYFSANELVKNRKKHIDQQMNNALKSATTGLELIFDAYITLSEQIASRTQIRILLEQYNQREIPKNVATEGIGMRLSDALNRHDTVLAIASYDVNKQPLLQLGSLEFFSDTRANFELSDQSTLTYFCAEDTQYLIVSAPVIDAQERIAGYDQVAFSLDEVHSLLQEMGAQHQGDFHVYDWIDGQARMVSQTGELPQPLEAEYLVAEHAFFKIFKNGEYLWIGSSVKHLDWLVYFDTHASRLFEIIWKPIVKLVLVSVLFIIAGLVVFVSIMRPLTNKFLLRSSELEEIVQKRTREIQAISAEQKLFASRVAHDLRSPAASLKSYINLLLEKEVSLDEIIGDLDALSNSMLSTIEGIYSLCELSNSRPVFKSTQIRACLYEAVSGLKKEIAQKSLQLVTSENLDIALPLCSKMFPRVFANLIANSLKFCETSNPTVYIDADLTPDGYVCIKFKDNGPGISATEHQRVFDNFEREHGNTYEGLGLGLSIVRKIVLIHGGKIELSPHHEGNGAEFLIFLPSESPSH